MRYKYMVGKFSILIEDTYNLINLDFPFFDFENEYGQYDIICKIHRYEDFVGLSKGIFKVEGKLIEGDYKKEFYSILVSRKIIIISDTENAIINVYADNNSIMIMSIYSFYIILKKHIVHILTNKGVILLHGSLIYNLKSKSTYMILGKSGGGKSSICWHLIERGLQLLAEDIAVIDCVNNKASGGGGGLYVTADFIKRFEIEKYVTVSPGRKMRIAVSSCKKDKEDISLIFLASGVSGKTNRMVENQKEKFDKMRNTQLEWRGYVDSKEECEKIINHFAQKVDVHELFLNANTKEYIDSLLKLST